MVDSHQNITDKIIWLVTHCFRDNSINIRIILSKSDIDIRITSCLLYYPIALNLGCGYEWFVNPLNVYTLLLSKMYMIISLLEKMHTFLALGLLFFWGYPFGCHGAGFKLLCFVTPTSIWIHKSKIYNKFLHFRYVLVIDLNGLNVHFKKI